MKKLITLFLSLLLSSHLAFSQITSLVEIDENGNLTYTPDEMGNIIPDFSMVGYNNGLTEIPDVQVKFTLIPESGDRYQDIQNTIDSLSNFPLDNNGHRGAILLKSGYYEVAQTLKIRASGIVIRGEGSDENGTIIEYTSNEQSNLFEFHGAGNVNRQGSTETFITDEYVPIGTKTITLKPGHNFLTGDRIVYNHHTSEEYINLLGMDKLEDICGDGHRNWSAGTLRYKRVIRNVDGNKITLDAPIVEPVEAGYQIASIMKYTWEEKIEECGIENIRLLSSYASDDDEDHGWIAIDFRNIENAWARNVKAYHFGYGCVSVRGGSYKVSILDCGMYDYKSRIAGGRRYGFNSDDCDLVLFKNCESDSGRHSFVQGSRTPGPNVYTNCIATNALSDEGPHHRWSTGTLWDNITTDDDINVQNRLCSGSGHGWAGVQQVLWNCKANKMVIQDPPLNPTNWAIGCTAEITNESRYDGVEEELGYVESINNPIEAIPSLYEAQLEFRKKQILANLEESGSDFSVYPNPTNGVIKINSANIISEISIYDIFGKEIQTMELRNNTIDLSDLKSGVYFLKTKFGMKKIIKK